MVVPSVFKKRPRTVARRVRRRRPARSSKLVKTIRRVVRGQAESKHTTTAHAKYELYHNNFDPLLINATTSYPTPGTSQAQRVGDQINQRSFYIRMLCGQKNDRPNCTWKIYVIKIAKGRALSYSQWFDNVSGNILLDTPDKDMVRVLARKTIKPHLLPQASDNSGWIAREYTFPVKIFVKYNRKMKFINGSNSHDDGDIYLLPMVYDAYGTLITDNIAYIQASVNIYYKDY